MTFERVLSNMLMRTLIFRALAVLRFAWMTATCVVAQDAEAKLKSVFKSYLDDYFRLRPLEAITGLIRNLRSLRQRRGPSGWN